jgi:hypothetical protein
MRGARNHHRRALGGRGARDPFARPHLRHTRHLFHTRAERGPEDQLVGRFVVEVHEAGVRLQRIGDLAGDEIEDLVEVERRVDRRDRLGQQAQMAGRLIHGESLSEPLATPITRL